MCQKVSLSHSLLLLMWKWLFWYFCTINKIQKSLLAATYSIIKILSFIRIIYQKQTAWIPGNSSNSENGQSNDAPLANLSYETMTEADKKALLSQICGVISEHTKKICTRTSKCPQHSEEQKKAVRESCVSEPMEFSHSDNLQVSHTKFTIKKNHYSQWDYFTGGCWYLWRRRQSEHERMFRSQLGGRKLKHFLTCRLSIHQFFIFKETP